MLVYSYCYHGSVDEAFAVADGHGGTRSRAGNVGAAGRPGGDHDARSSSTTSARWRPRCATGDVACVLAEPAMTNMGIVLPDDGYHDGAARADPRDTARC